MDRDRIIRELFKVNLSALGKRTVFRAEQELGRGGNGVAFLVRASSNRELVAKVYIPPDTRDLDDAAFKRFQRELELVSRLKHPFVVQAEGVGIIQLGAYRLPFYLMPRANGTLREVVPPCFDPAHLEDALHIFMRTLLGVSYLHHVGIVHRDLKPENVLVFKNRVPRVSDFGIAHVAPGFVGWSQLTVEADRLMNWDYYAPEQRFGDATCVDHRADIYALGLILYELVSGVQPVRPNLPELGDLHPFLAPLGPVFKKMTAHDPARRYEHLDLVIDDLAWALRRVEVLTETPRTDEENGRRLVRSIRSANRAVQSDALDIAKRLGPKALPLLHDQLGYARLDVALAAYDILGHLLAEESIPYLVAGLYPRQARARLRFPTAEAAAKCLGSYPQEVRLEALQLISARVRPRDIEVIVRGIPAELAYPKVLRVYEAGLLGGEYGDSGGLLLLLGIDGDKAWPLVKQRMIDSNVGLYSYDLIEKFLPVAGHLHQQAIFDHLLSGRVSLSKWALDKILQAIRQSSLAVELRVSLVRRVLNLVESVVNRRDEREALLVSGRTTLAELEGGGEATTEKGVIHHA